MIYTVIFDASAAPFSKGDGQASASRAALAAAIGATLGTPVPSIVRGEGGKPYDPSGSLSFNISHTGPLVAVTLSARGLSLGVDIEQRRQIRQSEKIESRLLSSLDGFPSPLGAEHRILFFRLTADGAAEEVSPELYSIRGAACDFFSRWVTLESVIKCDGGGFSEATRAAELIADSEGEIYDIEYGGSSYALAVAARQNR